VGGKKASQKRNVRTSKCLARASSTEIKKHIEMLVNRATLFFTRTWSDNCPDPSKPAQELPCFPRTVLPPARAPHILTLPKLLSLNPFSSTSLSPLFNHTPSPPPEFPHLFSSFSQQQLFPFTWLNFATHLSRCLSELSHSSTFLYLVPP